MKVGIMSMQRVINYGSFMQALGLKIMIEELGHEVTFIDYHPGLCVEKEKVSAKVRKKIWKVRKNFQFRFHKLDKMSHQRVQFERNYEDIYLPQLGITKKKNYYEELDTLVIGSDEVFNCLQSNEKVGYTKELFGWKNNSKRLISYAASFGNTTVERLKKYEVDQEVGELLKRFDAISVRDENSGKVVKTLTDKELIYNLDPVLVSDFSTYLKDNVKLKDYIIVYAYSERISQEEANKIIEFAKKRKKKLVCISGTQYFCDEYISCEPAEIPAYFKHADCIITDTFHGSIFSIITNKPFLTIVRPTVNGTYGNEEKLVDLLKRLHLESRIIKDFDGLDEKMMQSIDYEQVNQKRMIERTKSLEYLKKAI